MMTPNATNDCPGPDVWRRWLVESLPEPDRRDCDDHVETCADCRTLLDRMTDEPGWYWLSELPGDQISAASKPSIPGIDIVEEVGRGGHGVVFKAMQTGPGRLVALKLLRHGLAASPGERDRLLGESAALARLRHPNIVQIYDSGEADGLPFVVMEWMDGGTLVNRLHGMPCPPAEAARIVETLARAVATAHAASIVHRDLKPGNVLLTLDGTPKIADFGLAKFVDMPTEHTPTIAILGTPSYMAPEQADGESRTAGPAADIYALGAILYETLTGRPPFIEATPFKTLQAVREADPVAPRVLQNRLPRDLETICLHCLHKDPVRRYASAGDLADDLERFRTGRPIQARPVVLIERIWKWCRRHPSRVAALSVGLLALVAVAFVWINGNQRAAESRGRALVDGLFAADPGEVQPLIQQLEPLRSQVGDYLTERAAAAEPKSRADLNARLALLPADTTQVPFLIAQILEAAPEELLLIRNAIQPHAAEVTAALWDKVQIDGNEPAVRFRAACALAGLATNDGRWAGAAAPVAHWLAAETPLLVGRWCEALRPVGGRLVETLSEIVRDPARPEGERVTAASAVAVFAADRPNVLVELLLRAEPRAYLALLPAVRRHADARSLLAEAAADPPPAKGATEPERDEHAKRHVRAAVALWHFGDPTALDTLFHLSGADVRKRYYAIHLLAPLGVDSTFVTARLTSATNAIARRSLILALGDYPVRQFGPQRQDDLRQFLVRLFRDDQDPGVHSAVEWLVRRAWNRDWLASVDAEFAGKDSGQRRWMVTPAGVTMAIVEGPIEFKFGSSPDEPHHGGEPVSRHVIRHRFALATREVTVAEFAAFLKEHPNELYPLALLDGRPNILPVRQVQWHLALQYCRWLCEKEGVPESEMPYPPIDQLKLYDKVTFPAQFLKRTGYRLPTEEEWECAARAGTETPRFCGHDFELLYRYAWAIINAGDSCHEGGLLRPNDLGLFDVYGNVWEWTQPAVYIPLSNRPGWLTLTHQDRPWTPEFGSESEGKSVLVARGGSYLYHAPFIRSAKRYHLAPPGDSTIGFRIARTLPD